MMDIHDIHGCSISQNCSKLNAALAVQTPTTHHLIIIITTTIIIRTHVTHVPTALLLS